MNKKDIDELMAGLVRIGALDPATANAFAKDAYIAAGLTATGAKKSKEPELVRVVRYVMGPVTHTIDENLFDRLVAGGMLVKKFQRGTFVPEGVGVEMVECVTSTGKPYFMAAIEYDMYPGHDEVARGRYIRGLP